MGSRWSRRRWRVGYRVCVGGWIQIRMKCPKRGHVRRNNDEIELRKWQSKKKVLLFIHNFWGFYFGKNVRPNDFTREPYRINYTVKVPSKY